MEQAGFQHVSTDAVRHVLGKLDYAQVCRTLITCRWMHTACNGDRDWGNKYWLRQMCVHYRLDTEGRWAPTTGHLEKGDRVTVPFSLAMHGFMGEPVWLTIPQSMSMAVGNVPELMDCVRGFHLELRSRRGVKTIIPPALLLLLDTHNVAEGTAHQFLGLIPAPRQAHLRCVSGAPLKDTWMLEGTQSVVLRGSDPHVTCVLDVPEGYKHKLPDSVTRVDMDAGSVHCIDGVCESDNVVHMKAKLPLCHVTWLLRRKVDTLQTLHLSITGDGWRAFRRYLDSDQNKGNKFPLLRDLSLETDAYDTHMCGATLSNVLMCAPGLSCLALTNTWPELVCEQSRVWWAIRQMSGLRVLGVRVTQRDARLNSGMLWDAGELPCLHSLTIEFPRGSIPHLRGLSYMPVDCLTRLPSLRRVACAFGYCDPVYVVSVLTKVEHITFLHHRQQAVNDFMEYHVTWSLYAPNLKSITFPNLSADATKSIDNRLTCPIGHRHINGGPHDILTQRSHVIDTWVG